MADLKQPLATSEYVPPSVGGLAQPVAPIGKFPVAPTNIPGVQMAPSATGDQYTKLEQQGPYQSAAPAAAAACCCCCCCTSCLARCLCCLFWTILIGVLALVIIVLAVYFSLWAHCHTGNYYSITDIVPSAGVRKVIIDQELPWAVSRVNVNQSSAISDVQIAIRKMALTSSEPTSISYGLIRSNNTLSITYKPGYKWFDCRHIEVDITVPSNLPIDLDIRLDFEVFITAAALGDVRLELNGGLVHIFDSSMRSLNLESGAGIIRVVSTSLDKPSTIKVSAGSINVTDVEFFGNLNLESTTGQVRVAKVRSSKDSGISAKATLGFVEITEFDVSGGLNVSSTTGAVRVLEGTLNDGPALVTKSSAGGQRIENVVGGDITSETTVGGIEYRFTQNKYNCQFNFYTTVGLREAKGPHVVVPKPDVNPMVGTMTGPGTLYRISAKATTGAIILTETTQ